MNLMPEEKFIQNLWEILKKIKENSLYTKAGKPISISASLVDERLLDKLEEWEVLKIREDPWKLPASTKDVFYLDIIWNRFNELYSLCKNGFETGVEPEKLFKMIKEQIHPIGGDNEFSFEIWQLINSGKKIIRTSAEARAKETRRQFEELDEKQKEKELFGKEIMRQIKERAKESRENY